MLEKRGPENVGQHCTMTYFRSHSPIQDHDIELIIQHPGILIFNFTSAVFTFYIMKIIMIITSHQ